MHYGTVTAERLPSHPGHLEEVPLTLGLTRPSSTSRSQSYWSRQDDHVESVLTTCLCLFRLACQRHRMRTMLGEKQQRLTFSK